VILVNAILDLTEPQCSAANLVGAPIPLYYQQIARPQSELGQLAVEQLDLVDILKSELPPGDVRDP
jgi:hypothetical protein